MSTDYRALKEKAIELTSKLQEIEIAPISDEDKKIAYDNLHARLTKVQTQIVGYGMGHIFRFDTPKGKFYLVNILETDIPELMKDLGIEQYMHTFIAARVFMK